MGNIYVKKSENVRNQGLMWLRDFWNFWTFNLDILLMLGLLPWRRNVVQQITKSSKRFETLTSKIAEWMALDWEQKNSRIGRFVAKQKIW